MFFSKLFISSFALLGLASAVVSTPVAQPDTQVEEKRQLPDILGPLQSLSSTITPILATMTSTANQGGDISGLVGQLSGAFGSSTSALSSLTGQQTQGNPTAAVTGIVSSVLSTMGHLPLQSSATGGQVDSSMSNFLNVMNVLSPGILSSVGSAMPQTLTGLPLSGLLNLLNLNSVVSLLSLGGVLTGLLGGVLGGLGGL